MRLFHPPPPPPPPCAQCVCLALTDPPPPRRSYVTGALGGRHEVPVRLRLEHGKQIVLSLRGTTLPPAAPYIFFGRPSGIAPLAPVPLGTRSPPTQRVLFCNPSAVPVRWALDTRVFAALAAAHYGFPVLALARGAAAGGVLEPGADAAIELAFQPLEPIEYACTRSCMRPPPQWPPIQHYAYPPSPPRALAPICIPLWAAPHSAYAYPQSRAQVPRGAGGGDRGGVRGRGRGWHSRVSGCMRNCIREWGARRYEDGGGCEREVLRLVVTGRGCGAPPESPPHTHIHPPPLPSLAPHVSVPLPPGHSANAVSAGTSLAWTRRRPRRGRRSCPSRRSPQVRAMPLCIPVCGLVLA